MHVIKKGDTLHASLCISNSKTGTPVKIADDIEIVAIITNTYNENISDIKIVPMPQETHPGWVELKVSSEVTKTWAPGSAKIEMKVIMKDSTNRENDIIISTENIKFIIEDSSVIL